MNHGKFKISELRALCVCDKPKRIGTFHITQHFLKMEDAPPVYVPGQGVNLGVREVIYPNWSPCTLPIFLVHRKDRDMHCLNRLALIEWCDKVRFDRTVTNLQDTNVRLTTKRTDLETWDRWTNTTDYGFSLF